MRNAREFSRKRLQRNNRIFSDLMPRQSCGTVGCATDKKLIKRYPCNRSWRFPLTSASSIPNSIGGSNAMALTVVLAVGWNPWLLAAHDSAWRAAGYIAVPTSSIAEAFHHFKGGDFDLVLLGSGISHQEREILTRQIRETGAKAPVIDTGDLPDDFDSLKDAVSLVTANRIPVSPVRFAPTKKSATRLATLTAH
jgi:hypothetical protein